MKKCFILMSLPLILLGCMSSPAKKYYQIHLEDTTPERLPKIDRTLLVEPVTADDLYDDFRIIYRVSPFEMNFYSYQFWAEKPAKLIGAAVSRYLAEKDVFSGIMRSVTEGDPDLVLKMLIRFIEEVEGKDSLSGRLAMDIEFVDFLTGRSLFSHRFDRVERLAINDVSELPAAISKILEEELVKAIRGLAVTLK